MLQRPELVISGKPPLSIYGREGIASLDNLTTQLERIITELESNPNQDIDLLSITKLVADAHHNTLAGREGTKKDDPILKLWHEQLKLLPYTIGTMGVYRANSKERIKFLSGLLAFTSAAKEYMQTGDIQEASSKLYEAQRVIPYSEEERYYNANASDFKKNLETRLPEYLSNIQPESLDKEEARLWITFYNRLKAESNSNSISLKLYQILKSLRSQEPKSLIGWNNLTGEQTTFINNLLSSLRIELHDIALIKEISSLVNHESYDQRSYFLMISKDKKLITGYLWYDAQRS